MCTIGFQISIIKSINLGSYLLWVPSARCPFLYRSIRCPFLYRSSWPQYHILWWHVHQVRRSWSPSSQLFYVAGMVKLKHLGDSSLKKPAYTEMFDEARQFILECYGMGNCPSLHDARVQAWEKKMKRNSLVPPKLCALPPTEAAFQQNVLRAHLAAATMFDCHNPSPPT